MNNIENKKIWLNSRQGDYGYYKEQSLMNWLIENNNYYVDNKSKQEDIITTLLRIIGYNNIFEITNNVLENNPKWWNYKKNWSNIKETKEIMFNIFFKEPNKISDTTLASIYIAYSGIIHNLNTNIILTQIHDIWCKINAIYEDYETLKNKRDNYYKKYSLLSDCEKKKDLIWIDSIKKTLFKVLQKQKI